MSLACQHGSLSLLLLSQQETQKHPNTDRPDIIAGQDAIQKPLLEQGWSSTRATPTARRRQMGGGWRRPTRLLPARRSSSLLPQPAIAPCCPPTQSKPLQFQNDLGHCCRQERFIKLSTGLANARQRGSQSRGVPTPLWLWLLMLQPGTNSHITNTSYPCGNTSYLEQSFLLSDPKLSKSKQCVQYVLAIA